MSAQAVVLVGGLGTRLGSLTADTPKPMLHVAGKPFVLHLIEELRRRQIDDIVLLAGFKSDQVVALEQQVPGLSVLTEPEPAGTGGALRLAADRLADRFFLLNGDSLFDINLWDLDRACGEAMGLALRAVPDVSRYGAVSLDGDRVTAFAERSPAPGPGLINGGVGRLSREVLALIPPGRAVSLEREVYPRLAADGRLKGRVYARPFLDIGVPADFQRSQQWVPQTLRRGALVFGLDLLAPFKDPPSRALDAIKRVDDAGRLLLAVAEPQLLTAPAWPSDRQRLDDALHAAGTHLDAVLARGSDDWLGRALDRMGADRDRVLVVSPQPADRQAAVEARVACPAEAVIDLDAAADALLAM